MGVTGVNCTGLKEAVMDWDERSNRKLQSLVAAVVNDFTETASYFPLWKSPRWLVFLGLTQMRGVLAIENGKAVIVGSSVSARKSKLYWQGEKSQLSYRKGMLYCRLLAEGRLTPFLVLGGKVRLEFERLVFEEL